MGAITGGEIRGTVLTPGQRGPTLIGKLGVDRQVQQGPARAPDRLDVSRPTRR